MNITVDLTTVDYIALCPGYTDRLLHDENTYEVVNSENLLQLVRKSENHYKPFYKYGITKPNIKQVDTPVELKFWLFDNVDNGRRGFKETFEDHPEYSDDCYKNEEDFLIDYPLLATPVMIVNSDFYFLDAEEGTKIINTFYPKCRDDLYGSIIFGPPKDSSSLNLVDWIKLAHSINIHFCGCYDPAYPCDMKIVYVDGKSILIVQFDCESG